MTDRPAGPVGSAGLVRLRLDIAYDGTAFSGWARQPGRRTVEETLAAALDRIVPAGPPPRLVVAGRTDAGVHATGQVAHVDVAPDALAAAGIAAAGGHPTAGDRGPGARPSAERIVRRLAGSLPPDLRVRAVSPAAAGFDARFSPLSRRYVYRVGDAAFGVEPLRRHDTLHHGRILDVERMRAAAAPLVGRWDFAAFCRARPGATTVRRMLHLGVERLPDGVVTITAEADAFCHSMVRSVVGALLPVGSGRREPEWVEQVRAAAVRDPRVTVAPARGLTLVQVRYPPDEALGARAEVTRALRA